MIRHGLVAKAGGLERDRGALRPDRGLARGLARSHAPLAAEADVPPLDPIAVPDWLTTTVAPEPEPLPPIRPSSALGAADRMTRPGDGPYAPEARLRGTLVHALLERLPALPPEHRGAHGARLRQGARAAARRRSCADRSSAMRSACSSMPTWRRSSARARGPRRRIAGRVADGRRRAHRSRARSTGWRCSKREVLVADFKTTARPPRAGAAAAALLRGAARALSAAAAARSIREGASAPSWSGPPGPVIQELVGTGARMRHLPSSKRREAGRRLLDSRHGRFLPWPSVQRLDLSRVATSKVMRWRP